MTVHVFATRGSLGARAIVDGLREEGVCARRLKGRRGEPLMRPGDLVVNWGETVQSHVALPPGVRVLNPHLVGNKLAELGRLRKEGVPTIPFGNHPLPGWIGRNAHHTGGKDLLRGGARAPDYFVQRLEIIREFRIHIFAGVSIRAGMKVIRDGWEGRAHPWVRSWDGGWRISYGAEGHGFVKQRHRDVAKLALKALGFDFGAVDLGELADGSLVVFEVNSAPGVEGGTIPAYVRKIKEVAA